LFAKFRGKTAREVYRFTKGVFVSREISRPALYAISQIPSEMTKGVIYKSIGEIGEYLIGYTSFIGVCRWVYRATDTYFIKNSARVIYNFSCLPFTIYCKGVSSAFDLMQISKLETIWFGSPVYIFDDNRLWIEKNFILENAFEHLNDGGK
jgi:hypothetical protein